MYTMIWDFYNHPTFTDRYATLEEAMCAFKDADWAACRQPGADAKRITLRTNDGTTIKTKTYPQH